MLTAPDFTSGPLGAPWPASATRRTDGVVEVAGLGLTELAAVHPTPLYLLDEGELRRRARTFREAFQDAAQKGAST